MTTRLAVALGAALCLSARAGAQSLPARLVEALQPAVTVVGGAADHRVDAHLGPERTFGPLFGVQVDVVPLEGSAISLRALGGALAAQSESPAAEARDVGEVALDGRMRLLAWLDARGGLMTRTFSSSLARQRWTSGALGADVRTTLLDGRIEGRVGAQLFPFVRVTGHSSPDVAVGASTSVRWVSRRYVLALAYRLERYDFPTVADAQRLEQHSMLTLRAGYRFGKSPKASVE